MAAHELEPGFGRALAKLRKARGLSQEALAHEAGLHPTYISQLERGLKSPSLRTISGLAAILGLRPSDLVCAAEEAI